MGLLNTINRFSHHLHENVTLYVKLNLNLVIIAHKVIMKFIRYNIIDRRPIM